MQHDSDPCSIFAWGAGVWGGGGVCFYFCIFFFLQKLIKVGGGGRPTLCGLSVVCLAWLVAFAHVTDAASPTLHGGLVLFMA